MSNLHRSRVCKKAHQFFQTNCGDNPLEVVNVQRDIWVYRYTPLLKDKLRWCVQHIQLSLKKSFNYEEILLKYYSMFKKWYRIYIYIYNQLYYAISCIYYIYVYPKNYLKPPQKKHVLSKKMSFPTGSCVTPLAIVSITAQKVFPRLRSRKGQGIFFAAKKR